MKNTQFITVLIALFVGASLFAQEPHNSDEQHSEAHESFNPHRLAMFVGYGFISGAIDENGDASLTTIPVLGLDYEYWFNHKIGLALVNDLELASYTVERDHQDYIDRHYAFVTALVFLYEPVLNWALFAGPGYEFEADHNFPLLKIGTFIGKSFEDGWGMGLTLALDIKEVNSALSAGITVSKKLGQ